MNCARTESEQNLTAFQYKGEVYYRSHVAIQEGQELLVWYGADYGTELGIRRLDRKKLANGRAGPSARISDTGEEIKSDLHVVGQMCTCQFYTCT